MQTSQLRLILLALLAAVGSVNIFQDDAPTPSAPTYLVSHPTSRQNRRTRYPRFGWRVWMPENNSDIIIVSHETYPVVDVDGYSTYIQDLQTFFNDGQNGARFHKLFTYPFGKLSAIPYIGRDVTNTDLHAYPDDFGMAAVALSPTERWVADASNIFFLHRNPATASWEWTYSFPVAAVVPRRGISIKEFGRPLLYHAPKRLVGVFPSGGTGPDLCQDCTSKSFSIQSILHVQHVLGALFAWASPAEHTAAGRAPCPEVPLHLSPPARTNCSTTRQFENCFLPGGWYLAQRLRVPAGGPDGDSYMTSQPGATSCGVHFTALRYQSLGSVSADFLDDLLVITVSRGYVYRPYNTPANASAESAPSPSHPPSGSGGTPTGGGRAFIWRQNPNAPSGVVDYQLVDEIASPQAGTYKGMEWGAYSRLRHLWVGGPRQMSTVNGGPRRHFNDVAWMRWCMTYFTTHTTPSSPTSFQTYPPPPPDSDAARGTGGAAVDPEDWTVRTSVHRRLGVERYCQDRYMDRIAARTGTWASPPTGGIPGADGNLSTATTRPYPGARRVTMLFVAEEGLLSSGPPLGGYQRRVDRTAPGGVFVYILREGYDQSFDLAAPPGTSEQGVLGQGGAPGRAGGEPYWWTAWPSLSAGTEWSSSSSNDSISRLRVDRHSLYDGAEHATISAPGWKHMQPIRRWHEQSTGVPGKGKDVMLLEGWGTQGRWQLIQHISSSLYMFPDGTRASDTVGMLGALGFAFLDDMIILPASAETVRYILRGLLYTGSFNHSTLQWELKDRYTAPAYFDDSVAPARYGFAVDVRRDWDSQVASMVTSIPLAPMPVPPVEEYVVYAGGQVNISQASVLELPGLAELRTVSSDPPAVVTLPRYDPVPQPTTTIPDHPPDPLATRRRSRNPLAFRSMTIPAYAGDGSLILEYTLLFEVSAVNVSHIRLNIDVGRPVGWAERTMWTPLLSTDTRAFAPGGSSTSGMVMTASLEVTITPIGGPDLTTASQPALPNHISPAAQGVAIVVLVGVADAAAHEDLLVWTGGLYTPFSHPEAWECMFALDARYSCSASSSSIVPPGLVTSNAALWVPNAELAAAVGMHTGWQRVGKHWVDAFTGGACTTDIRVPVSAMLTWTPPSTVAGDMEGASFGPSSIRLVYVAQCIARDTLKLDWAEANCANNHTVGTVVGVVEVDRTTHQWQSSPPVQCVLQHVEGVIETVTLQLAAGMGWGGSLKCSTSISDDWRTSTWCEDRAYVSAFTLLQYPHIPASADTDVPGFTSGPANIGPLYDVQLVTAFSLGEQTSSFLVPFEAASVTREIPADTLLVDPFTDPWSRCGSDLVVAPDGKWALVECLVLFQKKQLGLVMQRQGHRWVVYQAIDPIADESSTVVMQWGSDSKSFWLSTQRVASPGRRVYKMELLGRVWRTVGATAYHDTATDGGMVPLTAREVAMHGLLDPIQPGELVSVKLGGVYVAAIGNKAADGTRRSPLDLASAVRAACSAEVTVCDPIYLASGLYHITAEIVAAIEAGATGHVLRLYGHKYSEMQGQALQNVSQVHVHADAVAAFFAAHRGWTTAQLLEVAQASPTPPPFHQRAVFMIAAPSLSLAVSSLDMRYIDMVAPLPPVPSSTTRPSTTGTGSGTGTSGADEDEGGVAAVMDGVVGGLTAQSFIRTASLLSAEDGALLMLIGCSFQFGAMVGSGGALQAREIQLVHMEHVLFRWNSASFGGAVFFVECDLVELDQVIFLENSADLSSGGGAYMERSLLHSMEAEHKLLGQTASTGDHSFVGISDSELASEAFRGRREAETEPLKQVARWYQGLRQECQFDYKTTILRNSSSWNSGNTNTSSETFPPVVPSPFSSKCREARHTITNTALSHPSPSGSGTQAVWIGNRAVRAGAGMAAQLASALNLTRSVWLLNAAGLDGGAVSTLGSTVSLTSSVLCYNSAGRAGGAAEIASASTVVRLVDTVWLYNSALQGGGMHVSRGVFLQLIASTITHNAARSTTTSAGSTSSLGVGAESCDAEAGTAQGGGMAVYDSSIRLMHCTIQDNTVGVGADGVGAGGGLYVQGSDSDTPAGSAMMQEAEVSLGVGEGGVIYPMQTRMDTAPTGQGGVAWWLRAACVVQDTILKGNTATSRGGGIAGQAAFVVLVESSVEQNQAEEEGGAVAVTAGWLGLEATLLRNNSAGVKGMMLGPSGEIVPLGMSATGGGVWVSDDGWRPDALAMALSPRALGGEGTDSTAGQVEDAGMAGGRGTGSEQRELQFEVVQAAIRGTQLHVMGCVFDRNTADQGLHGFVRVNVEMENREARRLQEIVSAGGGSDIGSSTAVLQVERSLFVPKLNRSFVVVGSIVDEFSTVNQVALPSGTIDVTDLGGNEGVSDIMRPAQGPAQLFLEQGTQARVNRSEELGTSPAALALAEAEAGGGRCPVMSYFVGQPFSVGATLFDAEFDQPYISDALQLIAFAELNTDAPATAVCLDCGVAIEPYSDAPSDTPSPPIPTNTTSTDPILDPLVSTFSQGVRLVARMLLFVSHLQPQLVRFRLHTQSSLETVSTTLIDPVQTGLALASLPALTTGCAVFDPAPCAFGRGLQLRTLNGWTSYNCALCPIGWYSTPYSSSTFASVCRPLPAAQKADAETGTAQSCPQGTIGRDGSCIPCPDGTFTTNGVSCHRCPSAHQGSYAGTQWNCTGGRLRLRGAWWTAPDVMFALRVGQQRAYIRGRAEQLCHGARAGLRETGLPWGREGDASVVADTTAGRVISDSQVNSSAVDGGTDGAGLTVEVEVGGSGSAMWQVGWLAENSSNLLGMEYVTISCDEALAGAEPPIPPGSITAAEAAMEAGLPRPDIEAAFFADIFPCPHPDKCHFDTSTFEVRCMKPHTGVLCSECDPEHALFMTTCIACPPPAVSVLLWLLLTVAIVAVSVILLAAMRPAMRRIMTAHLRSLILSTHMLVLLLRAASWHRIPTLQNTVVGLWATLTIPFSMSPVASCALGSSIAAQTAALFCYGVMSIGGVWAIAWLNRSNWALGRVRRKSILESSTLVLALGLCTSAMPLLWLMSASLDSVVYGPHTTRLRHDLPIVTGSGAHAVTITLTVLVVVVSMAGMAWVLQTIHKRVGSSLVTVVALSTKSSKGKLAPAASTSPGSAITRNWQGLLDTWAAGLHPHAVRMFHAMVVGTRGLGLCVAVQTAGSFSPAFWGFVGEMLYLVYTLLWAPFVNSTLAWADAAGSMHVLMVAAMSMWLAVVEVGDVSPYFSVLFVGLTGWCVVVGLVVWIMWRGR